ncbi:hypothetical protein AB1Y20_003011 [Prymnesium parvum]|uniref:Alpha-1,4-N-acetylglucosaminyltransferase n=1 Tax=Prymnesium parvum TaxID=97485 RepID=A0AB34JDF2_PRYPA
MDGCRLPSEREVAQVLRGNQSTRAASGVDAPPIKNNGTFLSFASAASAAGAVREFLTRRQFDRSCRRVLLLDDDEGSLEVRLVVLILALSLKHDRILQGRCDAESMRSIPCLYEPWASCPLPPKWRALPSWDERDSRGQPLISSAERVVRMSLKSFAQSSYFWGQAPRFARWGEWPDFTPFLFTPRPWLERVGRCALQHCGVGLAAPSFTLSLSAGGAGVRSQALLHEMMDAVIPRGVRHVSILSTNGSLIRMARSWRGLARGGVTTCDLGSLGEVMGWEGSHVQVVGQAVIRWMRSQADVDISGEVQCRTSNDCARLVADGMEGGGQLYARARDKEVLVAAVPCERGRLCTPWRSDSFDPFVWHHPKEAQCKEALSTAPHTLRQLDLRIAAARTYCKDTHNATVERMYPRIFHNVWYNWRSNSIPDHYQAYRKSCLLQHPTYKFILWVDEQNREFLQENYPWFVPFYDSFDQPVKMSDAMRYFLLYHYGGIYMDMDVLCLRPLDRLLESKSLSSSVLLGRLGDSASSQWYAQNVPNAMMISKPLSIFMLFCIRELVNRFSCSQFLQPMRATGAEILHYVLKNQKPAPCHEAEVMSATSFYPIDWRSRTWRNVSRRDRQKLQPDWLRAESLLRDGLISNESYTATFWTHGWNSWD